VSDRTPTSEEYEEIIRDLKAEISRLKEEIRKIRRDNNEVPPHYL
jgi:ribosome recycling factor